MWVLLLAFLRSALVSLFFLFLFLSLCIWLLRIGCGICWLRGSLYRVYVGVLAGYGGLGIHRPSTAASLGLCLFWLHSLGCVVSVPWLFRLLGWHWCTGIISPSCWMLQTHSLWLMINLSEHIQQQRRIISDLCANARPGNRYIDVAYYQILWAVMKVNDTLGHSDFTTVTPSSLQGLHRHVWQGDN